MTQLGMFILPLAASEFWRTTMLFVFAGISLLLIVLVLLQKSEGGGLGGAFGGGGGADSILGVRSVTSIKMLTAWLAAAFFLVAILVAYMSRTITQPTKDKTAIEKPVEGTS